MIKSFRFIFILSFISATLCAQDSLSVVDKIKNNLSPVTNFSTAWNHNPAAIVYTKQAALSDLSIGYEKQTGEAALLQTGTKFDDYAFRATSYAQLGQHHIWGKASYVRKSTDNMKWNESSDYFNVYPYVMADSLGGDNMIGEKYSFTGGYTQHLGKLSWGIQIDYWALLEYRSKDPRPDNKTSDLVFSAGVNYKISDNYAIGGGGGLRKYKQNNTLDFKSVLGQPAVYHMTGLGTDAYIFGDIYLWSMFNGKGYKANLQLLPVNRTGWSATLAYENFSFDKQVRKSGESLKPPFYLNEDKLRFETTYLKSKGKHILGIKMDVSYTDRQGTEGKFTRNDQDAFVEISSEKQYKNQYTSANLNLIYENNSRQTSWYVIPYASYFNTEESHKSSSQKMKISWLEAGIKPGISQNIKKNLIHLDAHIGYLQNLDSNLELPELLSNRSLTQTLQANYDYLSSNAFIAGLSARFDYLLPRNNMTIYMQGNWQYKKYDDVYSNLLEIALGVSF